MDRFDLRILDCLQAKPEIPLTELAEQVGLSHTPCWRRIKRLEQEGVIIGRELLLDGTKLGLGISVFADIKLDKHDEETLRDFEEEVTSHENILQCFSMSGASDFLIHVIVGSVEEYEKFLKSALLHLPGVGSINSRFALKKIKSTMRLPL